MNEWDSDGHIARAADLPPMDDLLRERLLEATTRAIRMRRHRRMALQMAAVALAFLSGMLTMAQLNNSTPSSTSTPSIASTTTDPDPAIDPGEIESPSTPLYADPEALAMAFDKADTPERLRLLRGAGDYELNTRGDVRTALAYYEQWVRLAGEPAVQEYNEADTWLLASLKHGG